MFNGRQIAALSVLAVMIVVLMGCASLPGQAQVNSTPIPGMIASSTPFVGLVNPTGIPGVIVITNPSAINSPNSDDSDSAQATITSGENHLLQLAQQATEVSLSMTQAANAMAQSTADAGELQKLNLNFQSTLVSQQITQAAGTQAALAHATETAIGATAAAMVNAATATQLALRLEATQTAQAGAVQSTRTAQQQAALATQAAQTQALLIAQAKQTEQAVLAATAYPQTATPLAATQAAQLSNEYVHENQSFIQQIVVPLIPILAAIDLVLFVMVVVRTYGQFVGVPLTGRTGLPYSRADFGRRRPIDVIFSDYAPEPPPGPVSPGASAHAAPVNDERGAHIEIADANEAPFDEWIADVEQQVDAKGAEG